MLATGTNRREVGPTQYCCIPFCMVSFCGLICIKLADFDEKCSKEDDWDVDMSAYYDYGEWAGGSFKLLLM